MDVQYWIVGWWNIFFVVYYTHELNLNDGTMIFIGFEIMMYKFVGQILNSSLSLMIAKMAKSTSTLNFQ